MITVQMYDDDDKLNLIDKLNKCAMHRELIVIYRIFLLYFAGRTSSR